ncbi:MAG: 60 kDa SS-A/Ro ribonucleoprotein [Verrucomicrobiales bacterium]|jgi:60 kDa SS-A/Ro ribonucleoprotein
MKFNALLKKKTQRKTQNLAGGQAHGESEKLELVSIMLTSFLEDKFYRSGDATVKRMRTLVNQITDKEFVAKAAIYARNEAGMRSVSHLVASDLAHQVKGVDWTKRFFDKVVRRPDDVLEILACYMTLYGKPLPNSLKKGLGAALSRFDAYQLAKYRRGSCELKLVDAVNLVHPPHSEALGALVDGTLAPAETWETKLTQAGQGDDLLEVQKRQQKAAVWTELIRSRKLGYFALLRNLRNILEQAPEVTDEALEMLVDRRLIDRSLVMPFRFRTAIDAIEKSQLKGSQKAIRALSEAVDTALANVPRFEGRTLVAMDCSGSMLGRPMKVGSLFASVLYKANDADLMLFSGDAKYATFNKDDATLTLASRIEDKAEWSGTNFHAVFQRAQAGYDRIVILSDMQAWMGHWTPKQEFEKFVKRNGKRPRVYSFDLAGYGTLQFPEREVYCLAGFSDKTMETMKFLEEDKRALLSQIDSVDL